MHIRTAAAGAFAILPLIAQAATQPKVVHQEPSCLPAIQAVEREQRLPVRLLQTIATVESGLPDPATGRVAPWPWTINVQGTGHFFASKEEAIGAVQRLTASGIRSIDVGCMHINLMF